MGLVSKEVDVVLHGNNTKHYEWLGYEIPKYKNKDGKVMVKRGTKIKVRISDLTKGSKAKVEVECDGCKRSSKIRYNNYNNAIDKNGNYYCKSCSMLSRWKNNEPDHPISETHPHLTIFFINKEDATIYTYGSGKKVSMKCPSCGFKKKMTINTLTFQGFSCPICSDGISYPEKIMMGLLDQINIKYKKEYMFKGYNYRFDFYFESLGKKYIVEMDGGFHYNDNNLSGQTKEESKEIDKKKNRLAFENGVEIIRIRADKSEFEYIKKNILNSKIMKILGVNEDAINWSECEKYSLTKYTERVCMLFNKGLSIKEIAKETNLSDTTIRKYLKLCTRLQLCDYDPILEKRKKENNQKKAVYCITTQEKFDSVSLAARKYRLTKGNIISCCKNKKRSSGVDLLSGKPLVWMYEKDYKKLNFNQIDEILKIKTGHEAIRKKVVCVTTGFLFDSLTLAAKWANSCTSSISACCQGSFKATGKHPETGERLRWMYKEDYDKYIERSNLKNAI